MNPDDWIVAIAATLTALGVVSAFLARALRRTRALLQKGEAVAETLLGRDEIRHPETGAVLVPATPGLGIRITTIENTLQTLASTQASIATTEARMEQLQESLNDHLSIAQEMNEDHRRIWDAIDDLRDHIKQEETPS